MNTSCSWAPVSQLGERNCRCQNCQEREAAAYYAVRRSERYDRHEYGAHVLGDFLGVANLASNVRSLVNFGPRRKRGARLRIRAYAHERLVLTEFDDSRQPIYRASRTQRISRGSGARSALDLRRKVQTGVKKKGGYGATPRKSKFTMRGKYWVMDGAHVLETQPDTWAMMCTFTYPGGTLEGYQAISKYSAEIVNKLCIWLRKHSANGEYVYVWEVQKRGAPHLHFLLRFDPAQSVASFVVGAHREWRKILLDLQDKTGIALFESATGENWQERLDLPVCDFRKIDHSVAKYLSKYLSKVRTKDGAAQSWQPSQWWGISTALKKQVAARRHVFTVEFDNREQSTDACRRVLVSFQDAGLEPFLCTPRNGQDVSVWSQQLTQSSARDVALAIEDWLTLGDYTALSNVLGAIGDRAERAPPMVPGVK